MEAPGHNQPATLLLVDGISPFFRGYKKKRVNWSKIPFGHLETESGLKPELCRRIEEDFAGYCGRVAALGYNAITLDDVAHLTDWEGYAPAVRCKIAAYRAFYSRLFEIAAGHGLAVYLTTDLMFYTAELRAAIGTSPVRAGRWLGEAATGLFRHFPQLAGIVTRFGESDGCDVRGDFRSHLIIRTTRQLRQFIATLLPFFRQSGKTWIFRTWSVGVYPIGDLMWHRRRFRKAFAGFADPHFILSLKYGESDFFRYLPLNANFFRIPHQKIIELQARREYEGFGEFPSFVGWDYEAYLDKVREAPGFRGAMVWAQTGGWSRFRRLTYVKDSSIWVELNVHVTAALLHGDSCDAAIGQFAASRLPDCPPGVLVRFLRLADKAILDTLYIREFAESKLFFRRLRMPPTFNVMWDRMVITHLAKRFARFFVRDRERSIEEAWGGVAAVEDMIRLAAENGIPDQGLALQLDTFRLLACCRDYFFRPFTPELAQRLPRIKADYAAAHRPRYRVRLDLAPTRVRKYHLRLLHLLLFRQRRGYRVIDHILALRLLPAIYPLVAFAIRRRLPKSVRRQAMGVEVVFK